MSDIEIPAAVVEAVAVAEWDAERARIGDYTLPLFEELHPVVKKLKLDDAKVVEELVGELAAREIAGKTAADLNTG